MKIEGYKENQLRTQLKIGGISYRNVEKHVFIIKFRIG